MERVTSSEVLVELYQSADGPRVCIEFHDLADYREFMRAIAGVRRGDRDEIALDELFPVLYRGVRDLRIALKSGNGRSGKTIYLVRDGANLVSVIWCAKADQWYEILCLLGGLLRSKRPSEYELADNIDDDAEFAVSYEPPRNGA